VYNISNDHEYLNVRSVFFELPVDEVTPFYSTSYFNYTSESGEDYLSMVLSLQHYDATWITETDGSQGVWLGIGFNTDSMFPSNVVVCYLGYFGEDLPAMNEVNL